MSFSELRAFLAVVEHGSFLAASMATGESRTTLRRQVDALEARTGVPLLRRDRKGVLPTDAGARLLETGRVMQREFSELLDTIRQTGRSPAGVVRVLLPVGMHVGAISGALALARATWPRLSFRVAFADESMHQRAPDADMIAWFGDHAPPGAWEAREMITVPQRLIATREYLAAAGTPTTLESLHGHALLVWTPPDDTLGHLITREGRRVPVTPLLATANVDLLHATARSGAGIAWVPDGPVPPSPGEAPLMHVLPDLVGRDVPLYIGVPRTQAALPKVRVFLDHIDALRRAAMAGGFAGQGPGGGGGVGSPQSDMSKRAGAG